MFNINLELTKKQIVNLLILLGLLLALPITLLLVKQRQEIRKRAAGSYEIDLKLDPSSGEKPQGETFDVKIVLLKTASREIKISGAEVVLEVDEKLAINSVICDSAFDGLRIERIDNRKITLMCTINIDTEPISLEAEPISLGTISLSVKPDTSLGTTQVTFSDTRVTEAGIPGQAPDVSTAGQEAIYIIVSPPTVTPTPTSTPNPTVTPILTQTPTPTPTFTITPTQTPVPTPNCPEQAKKGDYDCNGQVDKHDFEAWRNDYSEDKTTLPFFEYWRRAFYD